MNEELKQTGTDEINEYLKNEAEAKIALGDELREALDDVLPKAISN